MKTKRVRKRNAEKENARTRRYRTEPEGRLCDCGAPAAVWARDGWACIRCWELMQAAVQRETRRLMAGQRERGTLADIQARCYDGYKFRVVIEECPGCVVCRAHGTYILHAEA